MRRQVARAIGSEANEEPVKKFDDVVAGKWYEPAINWAVANGVTDGISPTLFGVGQTLTRGQAVKFITNYVKATLTEPTTKPFDDVELGRFYSAPIAWAAKEGVVHGYGDGTFRPNDNCKREEFVQILYNYDSKK